MTAVCTPAGVAGFLLQSALDDETHDVAHRNRMTAIVASLAAIR